MKSAYQRQAQMQSVQKSRIGRYQVAKRAKCMVSAQKVPVMVNSCSGKMGLAAAEAVVRAGVELVPYTLTGEVLNGKAQTIDVSGVSVDVVSDETRDDVIVELKSKYPGLVVIDYTLPKAVNVNGDFYVKHGVPFVMGTTGGDRDLLKENVTNAGLYAVIAPQMGKQIVAFQAMMEYMASTYPDAFAGYTLSVTESHQSTKVDTSGTAKAVIESFNGLGLNFDVANVEKVRDETSQLNKMNVPKDALNGHAYHTYHLTSSDGSVNFEFQHNVVGRRIYAEGTVDAVLFLADRIKQGASQKLYTMTDVLKAGNMR